MDELDLQKAISNLVILKQEEFARNLKAMALAAKAGFGSKEADREITKIERAANTARDEEMRQESMKGNIKGVNTTNLALDLKKLGEAKLDGGNKRTDNPRTSRQSVEGSG